MAPLTRGRELLESAVSYALAGAALGTPQLLQCPTPCPGWDLETLLDHVSDSIGMLAEAITAAAAAAAAAAAPAALARRRLATPDRGVTRSCDFVGRQPGCWAPAPLPGQPSGGSSSGTAS